MKIRFAGKLHLNAVRSFIRPVLQLFALSKPSKRPDACFNLPDDPFYNHNCKRKHSS